LNAPTDSVMDRGVQAWHKLVDGLAMEPDSLETAVNEAVTSGVSNPEILASHTTVKDASSFDDDPAESVSAPTPGGDTDEFTDRMQEATVWSPFHSEASAAGFATRLSSLLAHPFRVKKQGPAHYLVTYEYTDNLHRQALEQRIAQVTGAPST